MPIPPLVSHLWSRALRFRALGGVVAGLLWMVWGLFAPATQLDGDLREDLSLQWSPEYLLLAPLTRILDELSLLDDRQHVVVAWTLAALALLAAVRGMKGKGDWRQRLAGAAQGAAIAMLAGVGVYAVGALVPRPMVALTSTDPQVVLVDFHSHTERSHDGRWRYTAEDNRGWHASAGFHAAYVTDHQSMQAWQRLANRGQLAPSVIPLSEAAVLTATGAPATTILLPGIETVVPGAHVNLLGVNAQHGPLFRHQRSLDTVHFANIAPDARPFAVLTLPFDLTRDLARPPRIDAIELTNGAPRGIRFSRTNRAHIRALADSLDVPLVTSSNQHGWGSTATAWTAIRIANWRSLEPFALDTAIRRALAAPARDVRAVQRLGLPPGDSWMSHAATVPRLGWHIAGMATLPERLIVLLWIAAVLMVMRRSPRTREHPTSGLSAMS